MLLVEIAPERTDALLARARSFGESRLVCNAHWQSDIVAGRTIAAATVARLHADPTFLADLAAAREELREVSAGAGDDVSNADAAQDCAAQASQLAPIPGAL